MKRVAVALMCALLIAGCGGGSAKSGSTPTTSPPISANSPPTTPSTPPTQTTESINYASVGQYASIVAKSRSSLGSTLKDELGPKCDWNTPGRVDLVPGLVVCGLGIFTLSLQGQTLSLVLNNAASKRSTTYIGPPPEEIASLVDETKATADELAKAADAVQPCATAAKPGCDAKLFDFYSAMTHMQDQFAAWSPYL